MREHILIVDGYNVIGNWPELAKLKAEDHFDVARDRLLDILAEYRSHENAKIIVVFDAMYVPGIGKSDAKWDLQVVFTQELAPRPTRGCHQRSGGTVDRVLPRRPPD
jgi:predicted RNA-binding protein with PIN domain